MGEPETVIRVENVSKRYVIGHQASDRPESLRELLAAAPRRLSRSLFGQRVSGTAPDPTREEFWALKDVSFDVKRGEVVGIIGRNGAGKSTLLKILSRITEPTSGRVEIDGRVASLLEVGTGFHGDLTGRENIYLNGSILGMMRKEINRKFDEIVAFAEVDKFLDTPVKRYSSGMYVRLAFAIAAHLEPEILIVDEVLAVGDSEFQAKCIGKMQSVANEGRTVLFVSHNISTVQKLCTSAILLSQGCVQSIGSTDSVIDFYLASHKNEVLLFGKSMNLVEMKRWGGSGEARLEKVIVYSPENRSAVGGFRGGSIGFQFHITGQLDVVKAVGVSIYDDSNRKLINANTLELTPDVKLISHQVIELELENVNLRSGRYAVGFWLGSGESRHVDVIAEAATLEVLPQALGSWVSAHDGLFRCRFTFSIPDSLSIHNSLKAPI